MKKSIPLKEIEIWKDIHFFKDYYQVSNFGNVRSKDRFIKSKNNGITKKFGKIKKAVIGSHGYRVISLCKKAKEKCVLLHRLVAIYFVQGRSKDKNIINHIDGNKLNNHYLNLEWCSQKENISHSHILGLQNPVKGEKHHYSKISDAEYIKIFSDYNSGVSKKEIAEKSKLSYPSICKIIKGTQRNSSRFLIKDGLAIDINTL